MRKMVASKMGEYLSVISHPDRFRIIEELGDREIDVQDLMEILQLPQSTVSQHLGQLRTKGLVTARREGKYIYYSLSYPWMSTWLLKGLRLLEENSGVDLELARATKKVREMWSK